MLKEFFETLVAQVGKSSEPKKVPFDLGPRQGAFVVNGEVVKFNTPDPAINYTVETLTDFVKLCEKFGADLVLIGSTSITAFVDSNARLDAVHWERKYTPGFQRLLDWKKGKDVDQRTLVALLRNELRDTGGATAMLTAARNMKFETGQTTTGVVQRGDESLGIDVMAKLHNAADLPDMLRIDTTVFQDENSEADAVALTLLVDPLPASKVIRLQSLEDQLDECLTESRLKTQFELAKLLPDATVVIGC